MSGLDGYGDPIPPGHGEPRSDGPYPSIEVALYSDRAHIEGLNYDGCEFVNAYEGAEILDADQDAGRIIIRQDDLPAFIAAAEFDGFKVTR